MRLIGLTGGIGSGKSTVAHLLREEGIPVIEADKMGHRLLEEDAEIQKAVAETFGQDVMENGLLSREKLAARIFVDAGARRRLNALLHPAIIQLVNLQCADLSESGYRVIVVEAALIGEAGGREPWLSGLILVLADADVRIKRLVEHRKMREAEARRRMTAQTLPETKASFADWIIYNNGDMQTLKEKVISLSQILHGLGE